MAKTMREPMTPVVAAVLTALNLDDDSGNPEYEPFAHKIITAVLDNLDREAMLKAMCDCAYRPYGCAPNCSKWSARNTLLDAALAAVRPCPADATLATKENGDGND